MGKLAVFTRINKIGFRATLAASYVTVEQQDARGAWHELGTGRWTAREQIEGVSAPYLVLDELAIRLRQELAAEEPTVRTRRPSR